MPTRSYSEKLFTVQSGGGNGLENTDYEKTVERYLDIVYRVALSCCKNPYDAEDVVQTVFLKLLEYKGNFQEQEHLRRWLIRVTVNESHSLWRTFQRRKVIPLEELAFEPSFSTEEHSELFYAVSCLPIKYREVVHLYYYEEYSIKEIAVLLHLSETAIQTRLMRARKKLKQQLKEAWK